MNIKHDIYLISDSTGDTIGRIFLALKAQFKNFEHNFMGSGPPRGAKAPVFTK